MGYIRHHAIVVTGCGSSVTLVQSKAWAIFGEDLVSPILPKQINGFESFFIQPDGSKEGWPESDLGDDQRMEFLNWIVGRNNKDGSNELSFVEVFYGDDEKQCGVVHHN